jgi:hypothetical protein
MRQTIWRRDVLALRQLSWCQGLGLFFEKKNTTMGIFVKNFQKRAKKTKKFGLEFTQARNTQPC